VRKSEVVDGAGGVGSAWALMIARKSRFLGEKLAICEGRFPGARE